MQSYFSERVWEERLGLSLLLLPLEASIPLLLQAAIRRMIDVPATARSPKLVLEVVICQGLLLVLLWSSMLTLTTGIRFLCLLCATSWGIMVREQNPFSQNVQASKS